MTVRNSRPMTAEIERVRQWGRRSLWRWVLLNDDGVLVMYGPWLRSRGAAVAMLNTELLRHGADR